MSRLRELVDELCPDGVEYKTLDAMTVKPASIKWNDVENARRYIDLTSVDIATHSIVEAVEVDGDSAPSRARQVVQANDVLFATTRPTQMRYCIVGQEYDNQVCSTGYCVLRTKTAAVDCRYVYHCLGTNRLRSYLVRNQTEGNYPAIADKDLRAYRIPVPPIEVQREVVRILDSFQELDDALTAEIEAREKQFEFILSRLFDASHMNRVAGVIIDPVPLKNVRERVITPVRAKPVDFTGTIPWCKLEDVTGFEISDSMSGKMVSEETIQQMGLNVYPKGTVLASCSATLGVYCVTQKPLVTNQRFMGFVCSKGLHNRYLMYALKASNSKLMMQATTGTNAYISRRAFDECLIQVPDFELQQRISGELDCAYEHLISLRAERAARRKQFEYYRDKLLSFPEKAVS